MELIKLYFKHASAFDFLIWLLAIVVLGLQVRSILQTRRGGFSRGGPEFELTRRRTTAIARLAALSIDVFPLLGLLGTVCALLVTFAGMGGPRINSNIISSFAPGLTSTISGLIAAILNLCVFQILLMPEIRRVFPTEPSE